MVTEKEEFVSKVAIANKLGVSRSSLYYKLKLPGKDEALKILIDAVMREHPAYGHRRIALELGINKKRILRVMKAYCLKPARRCKTPSKPGDLNKEPTSNPDITRLFSAYAPDVLWTGDFTYINYRGRFIYLAVVQDRRTAEILATRVMTSHNLELVVEVMRDALLKYNTKPEYFHSDQGSEYCSEKFKLLLKSEGIKISNSPKASPWRNPAQESFFGRFKVEFGDFDRFESLEELMIEIYQKIFYYSNQRIHTTLKCKPREFREKYFADLEKYSSAARLTPPIHSPSLLASPHQELPTELTVLRDFEGLTVNSIDNSSHQYRHPAGGSFINDFSP